MRNTKALISMFATRVHYDEMDIVFNANKSVIMVVKASSSNHY